MVTLPVHTPAVKAVVAEGVIATAHVRHPTASLDSDSLVELAHLRKLVAVSHT